MHAIRKRFLTDLWLISESLFDYFGGILVSKNRTENEVKNNTRIYMDFVTFVAHFRVPRGSIFRAFGIKLRKNRAK